MAEKELDYHPENNAAAILHSSALYTWQLNQAGAKNIVKNDKQLPE